MNNDEITAGALDILAMLALLIAGLAFSYQNPQPRRGDSELGIRFEDGYNNTGEAWSASRSYGPWARDGQ